MKKALKLFIVCTLLILLVLYNCSCGIFIGSILGSSNSEKEEEFYNITLDTKELLDVLADDIYKNWYDCIYDDAFGSDINNAIDSAFVDNTDIVTEIASNTKTIQELYKEIKDGDLADEAKAVMEAYNEYYSIVAEVSGSFNDYKDTKEPAKKALDKALKNYYTEAV